MFSGRLGCGGGCLAEKRASAGDASLGKNGPKIPELGADRSGHQGRPVPRVRRALLAHRRRQRSKEIVRVDLARRLAGAIWRMTTNGEVFAPVDF
jgi:hypothetical protein